MPVTSRGSGVSYWPASSTSGGSRRWSFLSPATTRELTARRISGEMGFS